MTENLQKIKIVKSEEQITAQSGLSLMGGILGKYQIVEKLAENLPKPLSNRGNPAEQYITPIIINFAGGGHTFEDVERLLQDKTQQFPLTKKCEVK